MYSIARFGKWWRGLVVTGGLAVPLALPTFALAHVKWAVDVDQVEAVPKDPLFTQLTPVNLVLGIVALAGLSGLTGLSVYLRRRSLRAPCEPLAPVSGVAKYSPYVSTVLSVSLGVGLVVAGLAQEFIAPELPLAGGLRPALIAVQLMVGALLIAGLFTRLSAAAVFLLYAVGVLLYQGGMIDYLLILGVAFYLVITGRGALGVDNLLEDSLWPGRNDFLRRFENCPMCVLRIAAGLTLIWLGVDKWWHPDWSYAVIETHHLPLFGFSKEMYVFGAGLVETAVGLGVLIGALVRVIAVVLAVLFSLTALVFQGEIIGHVVLFGVVFALLVRGAGGVEIADLFCREATRGSSPPPRGPTP